MQDPGLLAFGFPGAPFISLTNPASHSAPASELAHAFAAPVVLAVAAQFAVAPATPFVAFAPSILVIKYHHHSHSLIHHHLHVIGTIVSRTIVVIATLLSVTTSRLRSQQARGQHKTASIENQLLQI